ncbi:glycosyltransferase family 39 protein [Patescibacteria group bacterium]
MNKKLYKFLILFIFIIGFVFRLYKINNPIADWHSFRQVDTASVARNFIKNGIDPLRPRYDDLSNIQSGLDNPQGWRMVEFPFYQIVSAAVSMVLPKIPIEISLRLVAIFASMGTCLILIQLAARNINKLTGILAGFVYAVLPYGVFYGRAILPDGIMVFLSMTSLLYLDNFFRYKKGYHIWISMLFASLSVLVKPVAFFLLLPSIYIYISNLSKKKAIWLKAIIYYAFIGFVLWWWRVWITQFPEGIPSYNWLFNEGGIRFKGAWFYWLFAERVGKLILGYWGLIPFGLGMMFVEKKESWFFRFMGLGVILYFVIVARGNVQHDYYQILAIPFISLYTAKGLVFILKKSNGYKFNSYLVGTVSILFMLAFSWYTIRSFYWINRPDIIQAGEKADQLLPKDAKVIAPYNGDTTFLYQTNRQGWPLGFDIENKIDMGASYYVTVSPTDDDFETRRLSQEYTVIVRNDKYAIIDLTKKKIQ